MISSLAALLVAVAAAPFDPCALLDGKTIAAVQGEAPSSAKASEHARGALTARQCFFALPDAVRSVSLEVTRPAAAEGGEALRERWERIRGEEHGEREEDERKAKGARGEEEEEGAPPRPVQGVGRAAVWAGNQRAGALYVLGRGAIVRVSVGGPASEDAKIKACSTLARAVLRKLSKAGAQR